MRWLLIVLLLASFAAAAEELLGRAAFGGWQADQPGLVRRITVADLPPPGDQPARASNGPAIVPCPPGFAPRVPAGFRIVRIAAGLKMPRVLRVAPDGDVFLAESGSGRILVLPPAGGTPSVFAAGLDLPYGMAFYPPGPAPRFLYVGETGRIVRFPYQNGDRAAQGGPEVIVSDLPTGGHWTRDLAAAPDGELYYAIGSASNLAGGMPAVPPDGIAAFEASHGRGAAWGAEENRAELRRFDPDGGNVRPYATGLRNCSGLALDPAGAPWCVVNERDMLGDDLPPDYATRVVRGGFYGWPWFYSGPHPDPRLAGARPDLTPDVLVPDVLFQPHSAPLGIAFYEGKNFPPMYRGDAFVTFHGSWNRRLRTGYKVVRLLFHEGRPSGAYEDFVTGFVLDDDHVCGRPAGVAVAADGTILMSEDANGTIWRISYAGEAGSR